MIKINLALKKQAVALDSKDKAAVGGLRIDTDALKSTLGNPYVRRLILVLAVAGLGTYLLNGYETDQMARLDQQIQQAQAEETKARAQLATTAGYDALKKQFDADSDLIKTKLATIQKLVADRQTPPKLISSLVGVIPKNVWITEMSMTEDMLTIKGSSLGFDYITDFMKSLGDSEYLSDLKLVDSQQGKNADGLDVATFDIEAKRK